MISAILEATARADLTKNNHPVCCIPSNHPTFVIVVVVITPIPVVPLDAVAEEVEMFDPCWFPKAREETNEPISAAVEGGQVENSNRC